MGEIGSKTTDHDGIIVREECAKRKRKRFLSGAMRGVYEGKSLSSSGESQSSSGPGGQIRQVIKGQKRDGDGITPGGDLQQVASQWRMPTP
jgi:hypothetical protein